MMISPENYCEEYLREKDAKQILSIIRGLKNEMGHLKNIMEHPDYGTESKVCPSESVRLSCTREYLERAKQALVEVGGTYNPSRTELRTLDFISNVNHISKFTFSIGGFFGGYNTYIADLSGNELKFESKQGEASTPMKVFNKDGEPLTKESFLEGIRKLHMGEWKRSYSPERFGHMVLDGTQWEIEIEYDNGHRKVRFDGDNSYPYNFFDLQALFGVEEDCEN
ncbi:MULTISPECIES: hypothetical protein [unclassified Sedimentibacter]|uniref:hypothetical protein n=1 Tax=unclassified Sedimentibacter TaxID=2649220 RepID=UPI0027E0BC39|nr:hypothetical protein [Sedimentibacter sp. MB35-C1]WMJ76978.1 hypothetical protein RBQ61_15595 [Sedimentibacter sp. MB35-C1]